jgi:hypothetical protein
MKSFDLKVYLPEYNAVVRRRFRRTYDSRTLEPLWDELRHGQPLEIEHLKEVFSENNSHFGQFWKIPESLGKRLNNRPRIDLQMPNHESAGVQRSEWAEKVVTTLFELLGSIDLASILLR